MVVIFDKVLRIEGPTVTSTLLAMAVPPAPVQLSM